MTRQDKLTIDAIRLLSAESIQKAKSGHPGLPMGAASAAYTLWSKVMNHNGKDSKWYDRDRFILSAGHGSMLLYSLLHLFGYGLTVEDLKQFRQLDSLTPGHPEYNHTNGVEMTTGPLGQGLASAVGFAIAETHLASVFNTEDYDVVNHYTYVLCGDGCLMEGITSEASSLAGTLKLGKLIVMYDSNNITIEGNTDIAFTEDVAKRYEAYGWQVINVEDANNMEEVENALNLAKSDLEHPSIIVMKSIIGYGCPARQGTAKVHGEPLGDDNIAATKEFLGWEWSEPFYVPDEVKENMNNIIANGEAKQAAWEKKFAEYCAKYPEKAQLWDVYYNNKVDEDVLNSDEFWNYEITEATRITSGEMLNRVADIVPNIIGGSADLAPSTKTLMTKFDYYSAENRSGKNMHFGIREFAMAAICNGMALHGGVRPYGATFFVFSDYLKPAMRLSAMMKLPVTYVLTHDSIGVGEDGPTHEPIEQLVSMRSIPGFIDFRPADSREVVAGWYLAMTTKDAPIGLALTRQKLPLLENSGKGALKGGYVISDSKKETPDIILMASGSEVSLVVDAKKQLEEKGIDARVVSIPSFNLFEKQSEEYKESVLPKAVRARVAVEAGSYMGWYKYVGLDGEVIAMSTFGTSGPFNKLFPLYGFTTENVVEKAMKVLGK
ncbi:MAG: transketolase [Clostridiales bacterium]|nr:transketolase [Clostridiales bacterium]